MRAKHLKFGILMAIDAVWVYHVIHYWDVMRQFVERELHGTWQYFVIEYFVIETWYLASLLIFCIFMMATIREAEKQ